MKSLKWVILLLSCSLSLTGCGSHTKVVFEGQGKPCRLNKEMKTQAFVADKDGKEVLADVVLLPGMVCGFPPPKVPPPPSGIGTVPPGPVGTNVVH